MKVLLRKYQNMVIYRQAMIMLIAAPVPAAIVKLQGLLLDSDTIAFILIIANLTAMASIYLNKLDCKMLFIGGNCLSGIASFGLLFMYIVNVDTVTMLIYFPIVSGLGFMFVGLASCKIRDGIKNSMGKEFNQAKHSARKESVTSGAAIIGQMCAIGFYMIVDVEPMLVLVVLEVINTTLYAFAEVARWRIVKQMNLEL